MSKSKVKRKVKKHKIPKESSKNIYSYKEITQLTVTKRYIGTGSRQAITVNDKIDNSSNLEDIEYFNNFEITNVPTNKLNYFVSNRYEDLNLTVIRQIVDILQEGELEFDTKLDRHLISFNCGNIPVADITTQLEVILANNCPKYAKDNKSYDPKPKMRYLFILDKNQLESNNTNFYYALQRAVGLLTMNQQQNFVIQLVDGVHSKLKIIEKLWVKKIKEGHFFEEVKTNFTPAVGKLKSIVFIFKDIITGGVNEYTESKKYLSKIYEPVKSFNVLSVATKRIREFDKNNKISTIDIDFVDDENSFLTSGIVAEIYSTIRSKMRYNQVNINRVTSIVNEANGLESINDGFVIHLY